MRGLGKCQDVFPEESTTLGFFHTWLSMQKSCALLWSRSLLGRKRMSNPEKQLSLLQTQRLYHERSVQGTRLDVQLD